MPLPSKTEPVSTADMPREGLLSFHRAHLDQLRRFIHTRTTVKDSNPYIFLITGPPGSGKTHLTRHCTEDLTVYNIDHTNCNSKTEIQFAFTSRSVNRKSVTVAIIDDIRTLNTAHIVTAIKNYTNITASKKRKGRALKLHRAWLNPIIVVSTHAYEFYRLFGRDVYQIKPLVKHIDLKPMSHAQRLCVLRSIPCADTLTDAEQNALASLHVNASAYSSIVRFASVATATSSTIHDVFFEVRSLLRKRRVLSTFREQYARLDKHLNGNLVYCLLDQRVTANTRVRDEMVWVDTLPIELRSVYKQCVNTSAICLYSDQVASTTGRINLRPRAYTTTRKQPTLHLDTLGYFATMFNDSQDHKSRNMTTASSTSLRIEDCAILGLDDIQAKIKNLLKLSSV